MSDQLTTTGPSAFVADALALALQRERERPILGLKQFREIITDESASLRQLIMDDAHASLGLDAPRLRWEQARLHLLRMAAACLQAAKQLGIDTREQAIAKEIPF